MPPPCVSVATAPSSLSVDVMPCLCHADIVNFRRDASLGAYFDPGCPVPHLGVRFRPPSHRREKGEMAVGSSWTPCGVTATGPQLFMDCVSHIA